jgi:predicted nucleic acid-binding protein
MMRRVFADTVYWVALLYRRDRYRPVVERISASLAETRIVTTEEVLAETLTIFTRPPRHRQRREIVDGVHDILGDPQIHVLPQSHESFLAGLALYARRLDQEYSFVDCVSMETMRAERLTEVLTDDEHFEFEGFVRLLRG